MPSPIRSRARSCTSCGGARWRRAARSRSSPTSVAWTPRRCSSCCWRSIFRWTADTAFARELWPTAERVLGVDAGQRRRPRRGYLTYLRRSSRGLYEPGLEGLPRRDHARRRAAGRGAHRAGRGAGVLLRRALAAAGHRRGGGARPSERPSPASGPFACANGSRRISGCRTRPTTRWRSTARARPCRVITSNAGHLLWTRNRGDSRAHISSPAA